MTACRSMRSELADPPGAVRGSLPPHGSGPVGLQEAGRPPVGPFGEVGRPSPSARCERSGLAGLVWPLLVLYCLTIPGCGSGGKLAPVRGKVTLNGQPLQGALVEFQPMAPGGSPSSGVTDAEGRYELMYTFDKRGAAPGEHLVSIRTGGTRADDSGREVECRECVPAKYNSQTELKRTVEPGRNLLDFDL